MGELDWNTYLHKTQLIKLRKMDCWKAEKSLEAWEENHQVLAFC